MSSQITSDLCSRLHDIFLRIAAKCVNNNADAQDLVQETLKTILEKHHLRNDKNNFIAWCYGILRNKIGNYYKRKARQRGKTISLEGAVFFAAGKSPDPCELYAAEELYQRLVHVLRKLDRDHRKIIWLLYSGRTREEMLKELKLSDARQLKNRIFRTRQRLKKLWLNGSSELD